MKSMPLLICGAVVWLTGCAVQQDMAILEDRVITLERQNREMQNQLEEELGPGGKSSQSAEKSLRAQYAGMSVSIETLQQDLRLLSGRIEEVEHAVDRKQGAATPGSADPKTMERMDELTLSLARVDQRVTQLEQALGSDRKPISSPSPSLPQPPASAPPMVPPPRPSAAAVTPTPDTYDQGKQAFDNGEWENSRKLFQQFIKTQPNHENVDNAQFWIGESYYNEQWFEKAILEYQIVIEKYPKGNKVPAAMLKQGLAFLKLGDQSNARLILKDLQKKFPQSNEARIAADKLK